MPVDDAQQSVGRGHLLGAFALLTAPAVLLTLRLGWDLTHPRPIWGFGNDPRVYGWLVALLWPLVVFILATVCRTERRLARKAKVARLLRAAEAMIREKRFAEAEAHLAEAKLLSDYQNRGR